MGGVASAPSSPATPTVRRPRFQATAAERQLFGVARWPEVCSPADAVENNLQYGMAFYKESRRIGQRIKQGRYDNIVYLWSDCRTWRANYENRFGGKDPQFGRSRLGVSTVYTTPIVPGERYGYMADRIFALPGAKRTIEHVPRFLDGTSDMMETVPVLQVGYTATTTLRGRERRLTQLLAWFEPDGSPLRGRPGEPMQSGLMVHTSSSELSRLRVDSDNLFKAVIEPGRSQEQRLQTMADLHWLLAHSMPDQRGSAAKSEMLVRAVGYSVGIELPPFASGIIPDLEAFLTPREEFVRRYPDLFDRHPLSDHIADGVASLRV